MVSPEPVAALARAQMPTPAGVAPTTIGPFRILEALGRGGMGVVYRATDMRTGNPVALKTVRIPWERHLSAMRREIQALAAIRHPGVVRIFDEGVQDGLPWYAMELIHGVTLREYRFVRLNRASPIAPLDLAAADLPTADPLTRGGADHVLEPAISPLDLPTADAERAPRPPTIRRNLDLQQIRGLLTIFRRLCTPLAFVHGEGLVHCDLKPENVILKNDNDPVLVDFGLISRFGSLLSREVLDMELFMGTAEYMAPEQWEGKPVDARTDLYALGCIMFECLTGATPFVGKRDELYRHHLSAAPPRASSLVPGISEALDDLLIRLLAKQPGDRIAHAGEVARRLGELGAEGPTSEGPPARPYLFRPTLAGRSQETHQVIQLISSPSHDGRIVLLGGESGIGKTRLAMEATRMARRGRIRVVTGECAPGARGSVLHPFRSFLLAVADKCQGDDPGAFQKLLGPRAKTLARIEPALAQLEGFSAVSDPPVLQGEAERMRLLVDLTETLGAYGRVERTFIVLDDLQWADDLTLDLLGFLALRPRDWKNVVLLATFRSEEVRPGLARLVNASGVGRLILSRLEPRAVERMVIDMLGFAPDVNFVEFLAAQSEGNPFFVAEYLRAALGAGLIARDDQGEWMLGSEADDEGWHRLELPRTLLDLVAHRLDGLSPTARAFVNAAAVLGREAPTEITSVVAALEELSARAAVEELLKKQVLEESESGRVRFSHDKLREVAYERQSAEALRSLHESAAVALEAHLDSTTLTDTLAPELAHHWERAGNATRAIAYLEHAASTTLSSGAHREATGHLRRAMVLASRIGSDAPLSLAPLRVAGWHEKLGRTYLAEGDLRQSAEHAARALDLVGVPMPESRFGWATKLAVELVRQLGHRLLPSGVYAQPKKRAALTEATRATGHLARIAFFENDPLRIIASTFWSINLAERAGNLLEATRNYSGLGWVFGLSRMHRIADAYFARARRVGARTQDYSGLIFSLTSEAVYRLGEAQWDRVADALSACDEPCRITRDPQARELVDTLRGHPEFFRGRFEAAIRIHRGVLVSAQERGNVQHEAWSLYCAARSEIALGRYGEAIADLEGAAALLQSQTDQMSDITCRGLLAVARLRYGDEAGAELAARETDEHIGSTLPTVFLTQHGYEGVAEVALARFEKEKGAAVRTAAKRAVARLSSAAGVFRVGQPRARLLAARFAALDGRPRTARRALRAGIDEAQALDMPYDLAKLHEAMAALDGVQEELRSRHREQARQIQIELEEAGGGEWPAEPELKGEGSAE